VAIVVSHIGRDFAALVEQALRQAPLADLIELRLDQCGHPGLEALRAARARSPKALIAACPGPESGGGFGGSAEQREALLCDAALAGFSFIDVDWRSALALGPPPPGTKCHRIVSRHERAGGEPLTALAEDMRAVMGEGDVQKLVVEARSCEDGLEMLAFLRSQKAVVGFSSGAAGSFTRVLAPIFGSPFTYAAPASVPGWPAPEATAAGQLRVNDLRAALPPSGASQETAVLGVVGNPIGASFSPWVQGMALKAARLDAVYVAFEPAELGRFLERATDEAFRGFSVTAPFKEAAYAMAASRDGASEQARAANTLLREQSGWRAVNTDIGAVRDTLERAFRVHGSQPGRPVALGAARALVLGTGGAARAAASAIIAARGTAILAGRDAAKARAAAAELGASWIEWSAIPETEHDVLVHCTPVGSSYAPGELAVPEAWIRPGILVLDAVYRPIRTPLCLAAKRKGCTVVPGGEWFVRQAEEQFRQLTQAEPDEALMRAAFQNALESSGA
jgi:shikimate dehydrogenase